MPKPSRRDFLKTAFLSGCYFATAGLPVKARAAEGPTGLFRFPQGLASADPTPTTIVFWTRVESVDPCDDPIDVSLDIALAPDFSEVVIEDSFAATELTDHTVRIVVDGLQPDTRYYYRFRAGGDVTPVLGRTRTAPLADADRIVRLGFASCQNYEQGYFGAWQRMIAEDAAKPENEQLDFVLHLGDFIYERLHYFGNKLDAPWPQGPLTDSDGNKRVVPGFPDGAGGGTERPFAVTLDDYRHLYKFYLMDPALQAARARWPFVCTWDDHEFTNNSWQSRATYAREGAPAQSRKVAANQAWFEYIPAMLSDLKDAAGISQSAHDFEHIAVEDTDSVPFDADENNLAALSSLTMYRSLRFGRHVDLVVTDTRSYRSDHAVPEPLAARLGGRDTAMLPVEVVQLLDAGRSANGGEAPETFTLRGREFVNPRKDAPPATVLGEKQKSWWQRAMADSTATWKLWANSIPLMPLRLDLYNAEPPREDSVLSADSWDGYPGERAELMGYLRERRIPNVLSLSGDHHMHFAGEAHDAFDGTSPAPAALEFSVAAISSRPTFLSIRNQRFLPRAFQEISFMETEEGDIELFNLTLLQGMLASATASRTGDLERARATRNPSQNPHLRYIDSASNGFAIATIGPNVAEVHMVSTTPAPDLPKDDGAEIRRVAQFTVPAVSPGDRPVLEGPTFEGTPPFPFDA